MATPSMTCTAINLGHKAMSIIRYSGEARAYGWIIPLLKHPQIFLQLSIFIKSIIVNPIIS